MELNEALGLIMKGVESTMNDHGFSVVIPEGTEKGAVPVAVKNGRDARQHDKTGAQKHTCVVQQQSRRIPVKQPV